MSQLLRLGRPTPVAALPVLTDTILGSEGIWAVLKQRSVPYDLSTHAEAEIESARITNRALTLLQDRLPKFLSHGTHNCGDHSNRQASDCIQEPGYLDLGEIDEFCKGCAKQVAVGSRHKLSCSHYLCPACIEVKVQGVLAALNTPDTRATIQECKAERQALRKAVAEAEDAATPPGTELALAIPRAPSTALIRLQTDEWGAVGVYRPGLVGASLVARLSDVLALTSLRVWSESAPARPARTEEQLREAIMDAVGLTCCGSEIPIMDFMSCMQPRVSAAMWLLMAWLNQAPQNMKTCGWAQCGRFIPDDCMFLMTGVDPRVRFDARRDESDVRFFCPHCQGVLFERDTEREAFPFLFGVRHKILAPDESIAKVHR